MTGLYVAAIAVAVSIAFGLYRLVDDGRIRGARRRDADVRLGAEQLGQELGSSATFVQFSSAVCAPCRTASRLLTDVVRDAPAVTHIEVDAETRLDLVEQLNITRTPTVVLLDRHGVIRHRIVGAPRKPDLLGALHEVLADTAARKRKTTKKSHR